MVAAALLLAPAPSAQKAAAQGETSRCDEANAGRSEAQAGVRCVCVHAREGRITHTPSGWQWDCSILRSRNNADVEASPGGYEGPLPSSVYIDEGWYEVPEDRDRDRKRLDQPRGPGHEGPTFHDRARNRSPRDRPDHPGWMPRPAER